MPIEPAPGARRGSGPREVFFLALATLLAGYWALNKPFAYLGVGAFYVSELVLLIGVGCLLLVAREDPRSLRRLTSPLSLALLAFAAWGAARTLPFLGAYGINALRDAVLWGYAAFALLVLLLLDGSHAGRLARLFRQLGAFLPAFFVAAFAAYWYLGWDMSHFNSDRPLLMLKAPDVGVALGAMAAARLLAPAADTARSRIAIEVAWWIPWWTALALYGAISRGALLAALLGLGLGLVLEMYLGRRRPTLLPILVGAGLLILLHASGLRLAIPDPTRIAEVSSLQYQRYAAGMLDMLGMLPDSPIAIEPENPAASELSATVARTETIHWRLDWWRTILGYTLDGGPYFWGGKGYGINLAVDDGFFTDWFPENRNPHSGLFTVLARSGVIGAALFLALLLGVAAHGCLALVRQRRLALERARVTAWLLAVLAVVFFNSCFDVYLAGPMGGIWFWSLLGLITVASRPGAGAGKAA